MAVPGSFIVPKQSFCPRSKYPGPSYSTRILFYLRASHGSSSSDGGVEKKLIRKEKDGWKIDYSGEKPATPLLDSVNYAIHMTNLSTQDLEQLAAELRADIVHTVSKTGGHLSSSLGVG